MQPQFLPHNPADEYYFDEGCYITELSNSPDDEGLSIARCRVSPGEATRWHRLQDTTERYYIVAGTGVVDIGTQDPQTVKPGDVVLIPPMSPQRITNSGDDDLVFLALCTPRFTPEVYEDLTSQGVLPGEPEG